MKAFPGYHSFPGGKVEEADRTSAEGSPWEEVDEILWSALKREMLEELEIDLDREKEMGNLLSVGLLGDATTPPFSPLRFVNSFYHLVFARRPDIVLDHQEHDRGDWKNAVDWWEDFQQGNILLVHPAKVILDHFARGEKLHPGDLNFDFDKKGEVPELEPLGGLGQLMPLSHTLPPADRTNCFLVGDDPEGALLIDPSPRDEKEYNGLLATIGTRKIKAVFITHHHGDHHQYAPQLARELGCPIFVGQDTLERTKKENGNNYFADVRTFIVEDGMRVGTYRTSPILVKSVPGHDEGQLALYPENRKWFLAGDLIQTIGTVVIKAPEGDMRKYFASLMEVIAMAPDVILPSHGIAMGGVGKLQETLDHRRMRELQVKVCLDKKMNEEEIFDVVYKGLDSSLKPLAIMQIRAHVKKIEEEQWK